MEQEKNQLLENFSQDEKSAYLGAIASITSADIVASEEEIEYLRALTESANLTWEQEASVLKAAKDPSNSELKRNLDILKNSDLKYSLITDIISFAKSDGKYTPQEEEAIHEIAGYLKVDRPQFNALAHVADKANTLSTDEEPSYQNNFFGGSGGIGDMLRKVGISPNALMKGSLAVLAPLVLSRIFSRRGGMNRGMGGGLGGGLLGGILGGAMSGGMGRRGGGLGSLFGALSGGRGYSRMGSMSGLGSIFGNMMSGRGSF